MQKEAEAIIEKVKQEVELQKPNILGCNILLVIVPNGTSEQRVCEAVEYMKKHIDNEAVKVMITHGRSFSMNWIVPQDFTFEELKAYLEQNK